MDNLQTTTRRAAIIGALVSSAALTAAVHGAPLTPIAALYAEWTAVRNSFDNLTEPESLILYERYSALLEAITSASPETARDVAMQVVAETEFGESEYRDVFFARLLALAEG